MIDAVEFTFKPLTFETDWKTPDWLSFKGLVSAIMQRKFFDPNLFLQNMLKNACLILTVILMENESLKIQQAGKLSNILLYFQRKYTGTV